MKRPEQHIIEKKSIRIFEKFIPEEWVIRDIKPDYGIDYIVEIFHNGLSTGKTFFVQLKGSKQEIKDNTFKKQIDLKNLEYYSSLSLPVLLVFVSVTTEKIWAIWANNLLKAFDFKEYQKKINIDLSSKYLIDSEKIKAFQDDLNVSNKFGLSVKFEGIKEELLGVKMLDWINEYYGDIISTEFNYLPTHIDISFISISENESKVQVKSSTFFYEQKIDNFTVENPYLYRPKFDIDDINEVNRNILKILAIGFAKYNILGSLQIFNRIISNLEFNSREEISSFDPLGLLLLSQSNNVMSKFNDLVKKIIDSEKDVFFFFIDLAYFYAGSNSEELVNYRIENLNHLIKTTKSYKSKGVSYYNLGNILKNRMDIDKAISSYFRARKVYIDYENREYWWRELAGLLFIKGHYKLAEQFYKNSLQKKEIQNMEFYLRLEEKFSPNLINLLIADCQFMYGDFLKASQGFERFIDVEELKCSEWILKEFVCNQFIKRRLFDLQKFNQKESVELYKSSISKVNTDEIIEILKKSCCLFPLNVDSWFNLGVAYDKKGFFDEALFCFIVVGVVNNGDKEAQFNALLISFTDKKDDFFTLLMNYILDIHGKLVINDLTNYIMEKNFPFELKKIMINSFYEISETIIKDREN